MYDKFSPLVIQRGRGVADWRTWPRNVARRRRRNTLTLVCTNSTARQTRTNLNPRTSQTPMKDVPTAAKKASFRVSKTSPTKFCASTSLKNPETARIDLFADGVPQPLQIRRFTLFHRQH